MNISFDNTENAFAYKTDKELKRAKFLFSSMGYQWVVDAGVRITPFFMKLGLPRKLLLSRVLHRIDTRPPSS